MSWDSYERAMERGPGHILLKLFGLFVAVSVVLGVTGYFLGWFSEAAQVTQEEFGPRAALAKYEWFKDAAAQLDKKKADIKVFEARNTALLEMYGKTPRTKWAREDRDQYNVSASELAGLKASYNMLAADYNAQMAKFNWRFAERGQLPPGATDPLPREFKPYVNE